MKRGAGLRGGVGRERERESDDLKRNEGKINIRDRECILI